MRLGRFAHLHLPGIKLAPFATHSDEHWHWELASFSQAQHIDGVTHTTGLHQQRTFLPAEPCASQAGNSVFFRCYRHGAYAVGSVGAFDQPFVASIWHIGDLGDVGVLECVKDRIPPGISLGLVSQRDDFLWIGRRVSPGGVSLKRSLRHICATMAAPLNIADLPEALVSAARAVKYPSARIIFYYVAMFGTVAIIGPFLPLWMEGRGLSPVEIGYILAAMSWVRVTVNPLAAHVADITGRRKRLAMLCAGFAFIAMAVLTQTYGFWGILAVLAVGNALQGPVLPVGENLCLLTIRARGLEYGFLRSWGSVAFIVVVTAAGFWLEGGSSNDVIYMLVGGLMLIFVAVAFLPDLRSPPRGDVGRKFASAPAWALLRDRRFQLLLLAAAANMSAHAALNGYSTIYWKAAGITESQISMLWSIGVVAEILLFWASVFLVRNFGPGGLMALGAAGGVIRWIGLGLTTDYELLLVFQSLHGLTFGAAHLGAMTYLQRHVPTSSSATGQALYSALGMGMAIAIMQPITGGIFEDHGGSTAFLMMAGLAGLGLIFALGLARRLGREGSE